MQRYNLRTVTASALLFASILICGCAGMVSTREHARPELPVKADWSIDLAQEREIDLKWWEAFNDPRLNKFMDSAITANVDLQILAARTGVAEAQIGQARASLFPIINVGTRTDTTDISGATDLGTSNKYGTGADLVWELDIWGKMRKGVAAQRAAYQASEADWRAGYLMMASSVAGAYFQIRQGDEQIHRQRQAIARAEQVLDIYQQMYRQGLVPQTRIAQQQAELHQLQAQFLELNRIRAVSVNALATLIGEVAGEFKVPETHKDKAVTPIAVPAGLPSELLVRRPDIVSAEYRLMQAVELEGEARLARLPTIGLTGIGGSASYGLADLLKTWTAGLSSIIQFPVFNPAIRARIRVSEAQIAVAEAQYRAVVIKSFEEVENLLVSIESRHRQQTEFKDRLQRLNAVSEQLHAQLRHGMISQLELLEQERSLLATEQAVLANHWQLVNDTVSLFKAVGGGWDREQFTSR